MWRSTAWITLWSLANIVLAFVLQLALAARFGASGTMDAYLAASTVPTLLIGLLPTALNICLIPVFVEYVTKKKEDRAFAIANSVLVWVGLFLALLVFLGWLLADWLMMHIVPGFASHTMVLSTELFRIALPTIFFFGLAQTLSSVFYAQRRSFWPALTPVFRVLGMLLGILLGWQFGIYALVWGDVFGSAVGLFLLLLIYIREGRHRIWNGFWTLGVRQVMVMLLPWLLGFGVARANPIVERFLASSLPVGSITYLGYAWQIVYLLTTLVSKGLNLSLFPILSKLVTEDDMEHLRLVITQGIHGLLTLMIPTVALIFLLGQTAIEFLFERGAFDSSATHGTFITLVGYSGALLALPLGTVVTNTFYAMQDTKTVAFVAVSGLLVMFCVDFLLVDSLGVIGLSIGFSVGAISNLIILLSLLSKRLDGLPLRYYDFAWVLVGTFLATITVSLWRLFRITFWNQVQAFASATMLSATLELLIFIGIYLGVTYSLKNSEIQWLWHTIKRYKYVS